MEVVIRRCPATGRDCPLTAPCVDACRSQPAVSRRQFLGIPLVIVPGFASPMMMSRTPTGAHVVVATEQGIKERKFTRAELSAIGQEALAAYLKSSPLV